MCPHRKRARQERRAEVARECRRQNLTLGESLGELSRRALEGEFVGQDDGNIFRVDDISHHFNARAVDIVQAVRDLGGRTIAGVILL